MKTFLMGLVFLLGFAKTQAQICPVTITHSISGNQVQYFGSSASNPAGWSWFFNGGTPLTSSQQNPVVTYSSSGQFIAALSVYGGPNNCNAALSSATDTILIVATSILDGNVESFDFLYTQDAQLGIIVMNDKTQRIKIDLKDLGGRTVETVYDGVLQYGRNNIPITTGMSTGIYLMVLSKDDGILTKKVFFR
ncbi:MAG: PKD domain-containing protein [Bacteroidota bacterium]